MLRRRMERSVEHGIDDVEDLFDPVIKMSDPSLEVVIPVFEETMFSALRWNDNETLYRRLREGVDINYKHKGEIYRVRNTGMPHQISTMDYSPLHIAALHSTIKILTFLIESGANVNIVDWKQRTPLHFAVVANRISVVNLLLRQGANIDAQSSSGRTPVLEAVIDHHFDCAQILVHAGADLDLLDTDIKGTSVLQWLCSARRPNMELIRLVLEAVCNVNVENSKGATPIMFAATVKNTEVIQALLDAGADINKRDCQGKTALHLVLQERSPGEENIIQFLIQHGADIHTKDAKGLSLLQKAVNNSAMNTIKILLSADVPNDVDNLMERPNVVKIFDYYPEFRDWLLQELYTPKSLLRLCRGQIRGYLGADRLVKIPEMEIPETLQHVLLCRDIVHV